ncbi:MAG: aldose epimerase family protein [Acidobacteriaceae bacterium]
MRWKGREATRLSNGVVELIALTGGGHLAEFRFVEKNGLPSQNVFWEAPWETADPASGRSEALSAAYGSSATSKFLAGYTGHALCLDYFGPPSLDETVAGLALHGEAAVAHWNVACPMDTNGAACQWNVQLPVAQLRFERKIRLGNRESVIYVEEIIGNERSVDHACHWVQHATFGPPFLNAVESTFAVSAQRGMTSPLGYENRSLLANDQEFLWPHAPCEAADGFADLRQPFSVKGRGFLAAVLLDRQREVQYVLAMNWKLRLGMGYCFRRDDFPWMTIWEENGARPNSPWKGNTQARGMEFGTTPLPLGREETLRRGHLWDTPCWCVVPAQGTRTARYLAFLFILPAEMHSLQNVEVKGDVIVLHDEDPNCSVFVSAHGCEEFLLVNKQSETDQIP